MKMESSRWKREGGRWMVEDGWWKTEGWRKEKRLKEDEGGRKKREEEG